ncbi:MAG: ABC transporter permease [Spirochaetota bacterium]
MRRIGSLLKKDLILGVKDVFVILEVVFAVLLVVLLRFVVPEDIANDEHVFVYDETGVIESRISSLEVDADVPTGEFFVDGRDDVVDGLVDNPAALGLVIRSAADASGALYDVELLTQPYTQQAMIDYIRVELEDVLSIITPPAGRYPADVYDALRVEALQTGLRDEIPFNKRLMPLVLMVMVGILGLFIMVSLLGQERGDQTIRAFRVSPGGIWTFMASKHLMVLLTGLTTFSILYLPMMGFAGYLPSLVIILLTIVLGSSMGAILAAYFDNPMASIGWVLLLMLVFNLPTISLFAPVFSPVWLRAIPTYHTLFGLDAAMFPDNNAHVVRRSAGILAGLSAALYLVSGLIFTGRIRKEN